MKNKQNLVLVSIATVASIVCPPTALSKSQTVEFLKYFNPAQKKGYQNESQDRVIKKKSFKDQAVPGAQAVQNKEIGLFASITTDQLKDDQVLGKLLADNDVNGLSVLIPWQALQPEEDKFEWKDLDHAIDLCAQNKKTIVLKVTTCGLTESDTPKWVFDAGTKSAKYIDKNGKEAVMPIFWDTTYLAKWANFVNALGEKYNKNSSIHSVGITGGGMLGSTQVVPNYGSKEDYTKLEESLKKDFGMSQRQLVQHWKYVADLFPHAFTATNLNFDIDPPTPNRAGQDSLDEISDYLIYRYGQRVYLTRQNVDNAKHGFDQYRVILKFKADTLTSYQIDDKISAEEMTKLTKFALDDGISFAEIPASFFLNKDDAMIATLEQLRSRMGYQLITTKVSFPSDIKSGDKLKAAFTFVNFGNAAPLHPSREFDKDVAGSYKVGMEFRDASGKPVLIVVHTPALPTNKWLGGKPIEWEEELTMAKLPAGKYEVFVSMMDAETKRKLQILDGSTDTPKAQFEVPVGQLNITN